MGLEYWARRLDRNILARGDVRTKGFMLGNGTRRSLCLLRLLEERP